MLTIDRYWSCPQGLEEYYTPPPTHQPNFLSLENAPKRIAQIWRYRQSQLVKPDSGVPPSRASLPLEQRRATLSEEINLGFAIQSLLWEHLMESYKNLKSGLESPKVEKKNQLTYRQFVRCLLAQKDLTWIQENPEEFTSCLENCVKEEGLTNKKLVEIATVIRKNKLDHLCPPLTLRTETEPPEKVGCNKIYFLLNNVDLSKRDPLTLPCREKATLVAIKNLCEYQSPKLKTEGWLKVAQAAIQLPELSRRAVGAVILNDLKPSTLTSVVEVLLQLRDFPLLQQVTDKMSQWTNDQKVGVHVKWEGEMCHLTMLEESHDVIFFAQGFYQLVAGLTFSTEEQLDYFATHFINEHTTFQQTLPSVTCLDLSTCENLSPVLLPRIRALCPNINKIYVHVAQMRVWCESNREEARLIALDRLPAEAMILRNLSVYLLAAHQTNTFSLIRTWTLNKQWSGMTFKYSQGNLQRFCLIIRGKQILQTSLNPVLTHYVGEIVINDFAHLSFLLRLRINFSQVQTLVFDESVYNTSIDSLIEDLSAFIQLAPQLKALIINGSCLHFIDTLYQAAFRKLDLIVFRRGYSGIYNKMKACPDLARNMLAFWEEEQTSFLTKAIPEQGSYVMIMPQKIFRSEKLNHAYMTEAAWEFLIKEELLESFVINSTTPHACIRLLSLPQCSANMKDVTICSLPLNQDILAIANYLPLSTTLTFSDCRGTNVANGWNSLFQARQKPSLSPSAILIENSPHLKEEQLDEILVAFLDCHTLRLTLRLNLSKEKVEEIKGLFGEKIERGELVLETPQRRQRPSAALSSRGQKRPADSQGVPENS